MLRLAIGIVRVWQEPEAHPNGEGLIKGLFPKIWAPCGEASGLTEHPGARRRAWEHTERAAGLEELWFLV